MAEENRSYLMIIAVVAILAIIALVMFTNSFGRSDVTTGSDMVGDAIVSNTGKYIDPTQCSYVAGSVYTGNYGYDGNFTGRRAMCPTGKTYFSVRYNYCNSGSDHSGIAYYDPSGNYISNLNPDMPMIGGAGILCNNPSELPVMLGIVCCKVANIPYVPMSTR